MGITCRSLKFRNSHLLISCIHSSVAWGDFKLNLWELQVTMIFKYRKQQFLLPVLTNPKLVACCWCLLNTIYPPPRHIWFNVFLFFFCSCCSYSIIKNPLNFNVHHKVCAPVNVSTDNYFWWINQKDKYVRSSSCSFQFSLYTSPAGAIVVMLQLVVSLAWLSLEMVDDNANFS